MAMDESTSASPPAAKHQIPIFSSASPMTAELDVKSLETAAKVLQIVDRYRMRKAAETSTKADEGALKFLALIYTHVKAGQAIPMCLPAFPFKSPNSTSKVLGKLPDRAEDLALSHLNSLCASIERVHAPGAKLTIISDGLVYNDLLGVADKDVWAYGEALRQLAIEREYTNVKFCRLRDLVSIDLPDELDEITYVSNATNFRRALLNTFSRPDWNWKEVSQSEDVCLTYRGYIRFLETDLAHVYPVGEGRSKSKYKRGLETIAREMIARGDAFANAVRKRYGDYVRLSIHPSTGATKLSISLLPTNSIYTTPWHCSVAYMLDGTIQTGMRSELEQDDKLELVHENGRPSYFREKSDLFSWGEDKGGIDCAPIYPSGWMITAKKGKKALSMRDVDAKKVRALAEHNSPVIIRGFAQTIDRDLYVEKAHQFGTPLPWKFGLILEVKDQGANTAGLNNVLSAEWMPFHYDGLFKTVKQTNDKGEEVLVSTPPKFQFFIGASASPKDTGFTLFSSSTQFFKYLPSWVDVEELKKKTWSVQTSSFDATAMTGIPLVSSHPTTGRPCLRYHEPWPETKTKFDATNVVIEGMSAEESAKLCEAIDETLHDRRVAYYHAWEKGDVVVSDNILMMHTRSDFKSGCDRELWRIHFD
ncbi:Pyoverdine biosynthesis [Cordyceps fumosorosea ARSEF 2679]|uniref:Pyoverdine biosynthesis n=1 Tax=Cordyceps fumosorosea (strain ARSEF 2679) TaxID=1081104 RepID=A0A168B5G0_CORFA|nr:Pyoverdine biosynthesis [Cordyceps fumosorosea ARSEF 2679]OAA69645.1 Pyoverdine biosynthesis [Cordyceps fumosorosea ARSEF 2679]